VGPTVERTGLVYLVTCRATGKHYVGQTIGPLWRRWKQHKNAHSGRANRALFAAIQKHGAESFEVRELEAHLPLERLNERELYWSRVYESIAPGGYNLRAGNGHAVEVSQETRAKLSERDRLSWAHPESRERRLSSLRKAANRPEIRAMRAEVTRASWRDPAKRLERESGIRLALNAPDVRAHRSALQTPEVRARTSELMKQRWRDPEYRAKMLAKIAVRNAGAVRDPETGRWIR